MRLLQQKLSFQRRLAPHPETGQLGRNRDGSRSQRTASRGSWSTWARKAGMMALNGNEKQPYHLMKQCPEQAVSRSRHWGLCPRRHLQRLAESSSGKVITICEKQVNERPTLARSNTHLGIWMFHPTIKSPLPLLGPYTFFTPRPLRTASSPFCVPSRTLTSTSPSSVGILTLPPSRAV